MVIEKMSNIKMKLSSKVTLRKTGKAKVDSESSTKTANSAKRKRVEDAVDMGQGDDRLPGTPKTITDVALVTLTLMARI